jgi:hypothetical protein
MPPILTCPNLSIHCYTQNRATVRCGRGKTVLIPLKPLFGQCFIQNVTNFPRLENYCPNMTMYLLAGICIVNLTG